MARLVYRLPSGETIVEEEHSLTEDPVYRLPSGISIIATNYVAAGPPTISGTITAGSATADGTAAELWVYNLTISSDEASTSGSLASGSAASGALLSAVAEIAGVADYLVELNGTISAGYATFDSTGRPGKWNRFTNRPNGSGLPFHEKEV